MQLQYCYSNFVLKMQETKIADLSLFQYFASDPYPDVVMWTML